MLDKVAHRPLVVPLVHRPADDHRVECLEILVTEVRCVRNGDLVTVAPAYVADVLCDLGRLAFGRPVDDQYVCHRMLLSHVP